MHGEGIPGFAHRADDIGGSARTGRLHRANIMPGVVEAGAHQVVHRRIDDDERRLRALLHAHHAREQHPGIADDDAAGFEHQADGPVLRHPAHHRAIVGRTGRQGLGRIIGNAKAAAQVRGANVMPHRAQRVDQRADLHEGGLQRGEIGQLAADMDGDALHVETGEIARSGVAFQRAIIGNAELVFRLARRNLGMGAGVDIRVDAIGDRRALAHGDGDLREHFRFRFAFQIELVDAMVQRQAHFIGGLADAGKDDAAGRDARRDGAQQLAARHDIGAKAQLRQRRQHGGIGVGLDREGDQRVGQLRQAITKNADMPFQRGGGIDIDGRADGLGNGLHRHLLHLHGAVDIGEMIQRCILYLIWAALRAAGRIRRRCARATG